jgi:hypothetical protein
VNTASRRTKAVERTETANSAVPTAHCHRRWADPGLRIIEAGVRNCGVRTLLNPKRGVLPALPGGSRREARRPTMDELRCYSERSSE